MRSLPLRGKSHTDITVSPFQASPLLLEGFVVYALACQATTLKRTQRTYLSVCRVSVFRGTAIIVFLRSFFMKCGQLQMQRRTTLNSLLFPLLTIGKRPNHTVTPNDDPRGNGGFFANEGQPRI